MNRIIKEATDKSFHYDKHEQLRQHLATSLAAHNFAMRLKTLRGLTTHELVCSKWQDRYNRFIRDPVHHQNAGLYTWPRSTSRRPDRPSHSINHCAHR